ncbi:hypothetical protein [Actinomadura opuntiae]|uniref:hypothetical protein n=1 Tax=Actinomadura sp. OS1-43 TaxID=604315 RepID=UPI00255A9A6D|nr:hypothetical protein [Actinomadura sp. OS1-43]MDL4814973.1 hypothetical protein [Actinomadura sp. OS1-43]
MARERQARRCKARRTDGEPCRAWAMAGATTCRVHGASAPQVRAAAEGRVTEADARRAMNAAADRLAVEYRNWQVKRLATASALLGKQPRDLLTPDGRVNELALAICRLLHGEPDPPEAAPTMRIDRRFRAARNTMRE